MTCRAKSGGQVAAVAAASRFQDEGPAMLAEAADLTENLKSQVGSATRVIIAHPHRAAFPGCAAATGGAGDGRRAH